MNRPWPKERLGQLLRHRKEFVTIDDLAVYRRPRVQLHAQGIVLRDEVPGALVKTKQQQICRAGELLVAEIDAKVGGIGIVPDALSGAIVSSHYFLFQIDETNLDRRFLAAFVQTRTFLDQIEAQGSTNYAAIRPADVLGYEIPLPPIAAQRRVVTRIEDLAAKIHEARTLRQHTSAATEAMLSSFVSSLCGSPTWETVTIENLVGRESLRNGKSVKSSDSSGSIRCLTLSAMRQGRVEIRDSKPVPLMPTDADPFLVKKGDVFVMRGNGSKRLCGLAGLVTDTPEGLIFPDLFIQVPLPVDRICPEFFVAVWNSPLTRASIEDTAKTTSGIWKVNQRHVASTRIPLPPMSVQRRIVAALDALRMNLEPLKQLHAKTTDELEALLPAILDRAFKGEL